MFFCRHHNIFFVLIFLLLVTTSGCANGFNIFNKKSVSSDSHVYKSKEFKKLVESDPFPEADGWKSGQK